jgi:hypothetical protein
MDNAILIAQIVAFLWVGIGAAVYHYLESQDTWLSSLFGLASFVTTVAVFILIQGSIH